MNKCLQCQEETSNPKFCGSSCAAKYNNVRFPKRKPSYNCRKCEVPIAAGRSFCKVCWEEKRTAESMERWENVTLAEAKGTGNANAGSRYPYIRQLSRKKYLESDKPKLCVKCGYTLHFDVCHIQEVKSFPEDTLISEVNSLDNLIALCKNHHWELDHGFLELD